MQITKGLGLRESVYYENIRQLILDLEVRYQKQDAFIFRYNPEEAEIHKTYQNFTDDIKAIATGLYGLGLEDKHMAVVGENSYEWMVSYCAILSGVGTGVPLDRLLPENEVESLLKRGKVEGIFYHPKHHQMMCSLKDKVDLKYFICMDKNRIEDPWPEDARFIDYTVLLEQGQVEIQAGNKSFWDKEIDSKAVNILLFTSGTTASSKGVMLTQSNICSNIYAIGGSLEIFSGERAFSVLPLHHTFENTCDFYILSRGGVICFSDGLRYLLKNINEWHVEVMISVPLLWESVHSKIMAGIKESGKDKLISIAVPITRFLRKFKIDIRRKVFLDIIQKLGGHLRLVVIGGAGIDKSIIEDFNNFGLDFFMGYGLTETAPVISTTVQECNIYGSVGRPLRDVEVAIDTDSDQPGEIGEIWTRSDCVMVGYYENPEATGEVLTGDGWFKTGDMGFLDKKGCLHITGRVKSMIVLPSGKKIFPEEIESLINLVPGIKESFVWPEEVKKDHWEICCKILVDRQIIGSLLPIPEKTPGDIAVFSYLFQHVKDINRQMPSFKSVKNIIFSEGEMVKTTTLKIKRRDELASIRQKLEEAKVSIKEAQGQNIDTL